MDDSACRLFFSAPSLGAHRLYEALRAVFVEGLPQGEAAGRFGFTPGALRQHVLRFRRSLASGAAPPFSPPRARPLVTPNGRTIMSYRNGTLIRETGTTAIYLVVFGDRCWVPNPTTYGNLFLDSTAVKEISKAEMAAVPVGPDLTDGAYLGAVDGDPHVYLVSWRMANHIASPAVFNQFGFNEKKIRKSPTVGAVPKGWTLTA